MYTFSKLERSGPGISCCCVAILMVCFLLAAPVAARDIITDRPDQTESAFSVPSGLFQLEVGGTHTLVESDDGDFRTNEFPQSLLRVGVYEGLEVRIGFSGIIWENPAGDDNSVEGIGDANLGAKLELWEEAKARPAVALLASASIPIGEEGFTSDAVDPSARLILSNTLSDRFSLGYNVGVTTTTVTLADDDEKLQIFGLYTVSLGIGLAPRLGGFAEFFGEIRVDENDLPTHSFDCGFTYLLMPNLQLDASGGVGLSSASPDWFVGAGVSVRFPR